ncbi:uncharacterized protein AC631_05846 [Debaryomyces fabryi]|uniref:L-lactate dehydrogenase (cytochrome) n=1 Tax=Debaryomyces fabryi TaxID=58627 RepID=A0A0V1PQE2_9ASCO|nr:uncharacterized protein AC631_05846 [Debaryomyces fabryi]KRZ98394.1 hypothetical protein AC631_05846 [Debaryomyces fabryi]CUM55893.1 unnamed protein product [Debaryomyces fabryi]
MIGLRTSVFKHRHCGKLNFGLRLRFSTKAFRSPLNQGRKIKSGVWVPSIILLGSIAAFLSQNDNIALDSQKKKGVTVEELRAHDASSDQIWVALNGQVYDLTDFLVQHPGGADIIKHYAGCDASLIFNKFHAKDVFSKYLSPENYLGPLIGEMEKAADITEDNDEERLERIENKPPLAAMFNLSDFEYVAKAILPKSAWSYYSGGSDDEVTMRENNNAFLRIFFNPKVLIDTSDIDMSTEMLGTKTDAPFYCSAAAAAKLGHPDGELSIAEGCGSENIIQMISSAASYSFDEISEFAKKGTSQWFQLYVHKDRTLSYEMLEACEKKGIKGIFVTVDTPLFGRREKDLRFKVGQTDDDESDETSGSDDFILSYKDAGLCWDDIDKFKKATNLPIVVKGVQRVEDVLLAIEHKVDGVVLSNHGGRQLDFARAPIEVLADVMPVLREKKLENEIEIYIDGGIRRGSDVIKALCLGAKGVGLGRSFLYANSAYGKRGVVKACELLKDEIARDMKLLGVSKLDELKPELLDLRSLHSRPIYQSMVGSNYEPLYLPKFKNDDD